MKWSLLVSLLALLTTGCYTITGSDGRVWSCEDIAGYGTTCATHDPQTGVWETVVIPIVP